MPEWREEPLVEETLVAPPGPPPPVAPPPPPDGEGLDRALAIGLVVLLLLVLGGIAALYLLGRDGDDKSGAQTTQPAATAKAATTPVVPPVRRKPGGTAAPPPRRTKPAAARAVEVPGVTGLSAGDATAKLTAAGLKARTRSAASKQRPGTVLSQAPAEGASVQRGDPIVLTLAKPLPKVTVPDLVGAKRADAKRRLKELGFIPQVHLVPSTDPPGHVIAQHPKAGALLARGTRVRLNVGRAVTTGGTSPPPPGTTSTPTAPTPTTADEADVPDVTSLDEQEASQELQDAGFRVETSDQDTTEQSEDGLVLDQTPAGGGRARAGSTVTIVVGRYSG